MTVRSPQARASFIEWVTIITVKLNSLTIFFVRSIMNAAIRGSSAAVCSSKSKSLLSDSVAITKLTA
ncbi:Uncharacterised protein [Vibrio cholerae]|nr:Uncharacterised protein [Vibrio cholerae]CSH87798.1 Uncharacterised protein [Vibrio cholerae]